MAESKQSMTYDYKCDECGVEFEIIASFETALTIEVGCPNCYSKKVKRLYKPFNFILKGKGFYKTENSQDVRSG